MAMEYTRSLYVSKRTLKASGSPTGVGSGNCSVSSFSAIKIAVLMRFRVLPFTAWTHQTGDFFPLFSKRNPVIVLAPHPVRKGTFNESNNRPEGSAGFAQCRFCDGLG